MSATRRLWEARFKTIGWKIGSCFEWLGNRSFGMGKLRHLDLSDWILAFLLMMAALVFFSAIFAMGVGIYSSQDATAEDFSKAMAKGDCERAAIEKRLENLSAPLSKQDIAREVRTCSQFRAAAIQKRIVVK